MNANAIAKNYSRLTPEERFHLILAASGRGDEAERDRLLHARMRINDSLRVWGSSHRLAAWDGLVDPSEHSLLDGRESGAIGNISPQAFARHRDTKNALGVALACA